MKSFKRTDLKAFRAHFTQSIYLAVRVVYLSIFMVTFLAVTPAHCAEKLRYAVINNPNDHVSLNIDSEKLLTDPMWDAFRRQLLYQLIKKLESQPDIEVLSREKITSLSAGIQKTKEIEFLMLLEEHLIRNNDVDVVIGVDAPRLGNNTQMDSSSRVTGPRFQSKPVVELHVDIAYAKVNPYDHSLRSSDRETASAKSTCSASYVSSSFGADPYQSEQIIGAEQLTIINDLTDKLIADIAATTSTLVIAKHAPKEPVRVVAQSPETASSTPLAASKVTSKAINDKWALVIGISKFANPQYNLKYAAKDAQDFYNYLVTDGKFKRDHVVLLLNEKATRRNIMAAFGDKFLPAVAREGDLVAIYVSTHGTPSAKDPGKRNFLVAYDTEADALYETGIDMDELSRRIREGVQTDRALIVLDTCYSGAGVPGSRAIGDVANFDAKQIAQGFGHLVISSSSPTERSWESKSSQNGVFTKYFIQNLKKYNGNVKNAYEKLSEDVDWEVKSTYNQKQHPQLGGNWEGEEMIFSAPASSPRTVLNPELIKLMNLQQPAASAPKATTKN